MDRLIQNLFFLFLFLLSFALTKAPSYNWDLVGYMGIITEYEEKSPQKIHAIVYEKLKQQVPSEKFELLTQSNAYVKKCFDSSNFYNEQLSFYRVKPLYTLIIYCIKKLGISLRFAFILLSISGFIGILLLAFFWLKKETNTKYAVTVTSTLAFFFPLISLARISTPDAISNFLILLAFYFFQKKTKLIVLILILTCAILVRIDNIIFAFILLLFTFFPKKAFFHLKAQVIRTAGVFAVSSVILILIISLGVGNSLDWFSKFTHTFSVSNYFEEASSIPISVIQFSSFPIIICFLFISFKKIQQRFHNSLYIIFIVMLIRLVLFPSFQERFFIAFEITILIIVAISIRNHSTKRLNQKII